MLDLAEHTCSIAAYSVIACIVSGNEPSVLLFFSVHCHYSQDKIFTNMVFVTHLEEKFRDKIYNGSRWQNINFVIGHYPTITDHPLFLVSTGVREVISKVRHTDELQSADA